MDGMTRAEIDRAERGDMAATKTLLRPRDSATLILLDRRDGDIHVLMGKRHARHAFMPGKFVFPGGRTDPHDSRIRISEGLHPDEEAKIGRVGAKSSSARARAIALSAVRETYEEAGLLIGRRGPFSTTRADWQGFSDHGVQPALGALRFVARAITPPGRVRRFDSRFLACWKSDVAVVLPDGGPTDELEEIAWLPIAEAKAADIPSITKTVLEELERRLVDDPLLRPGGPVPFYHLVRNRFVRDLL